MFLLGGFIVAEQIVGLICLFLGIGVLVVCARIEKKERAVRRDPKEKWAFIDGQKKEEVARQNIRGMILTVVGLALCVYGFVSFMMNLNLPTE